MRTFILLCAIAGGAISLGACATITRGSVAQIQIQSEPSGAEARLSTGVVCITPCTLTIGRKDEFAVMITKAGFEQELVDVRTRVAGEGVAAGVVGNAVLGGVIGAVADTSTGAMLEHYPNPLRVTLYPKGKKPAGAPTLLPPDPSRPPAAGVPAD